MFGRAASGPLPATKTNAAEWSSDLLFIRRRANGDKVAMHALFAKYRTQVYRWLLRFVGNEAQAEDILSEVFLDVWRQADRFEARSSVSTWILSIARFKALSARRRRPEAELDETIEATLVDPSDDPALALEKKSQREALRRALAKLSSDHRSLISFTITRSRSTKPRRLSASRPRRCRRACSRARSGKPRGRHA
jgi:RNA polymerase sigma-70 factor (ECF subfamily)